MQRVHKTEPNILERRIFEDRRIYLSTLMIDWSIVSAYACGQPINGNWILFSAMVPRSLFLPGRDGKTERFAKARFAKKCGRRCQRTKAETEACILQSDYLAE